MRRISLSHTVSYLLAGTAMLGLVAGPLATVAPAAPAAAAGGAAAPEKPAGGTTLIDTLRVQGNDLRTFPRMPRVGSWGLLLGRPDGGPQGAGVQIDKPGQAVAYPTTELLGGPAGTIEFSVLATTPTAADKTGRVLLDSWPAAGNSRWQLALQGTKLVLTMTDEAGKASTIETEVNWPDASPHKITILYDAADLTLSIDGAPRGKVDKAGVPNREPLGLILGNSRELQSPALLAVSDLRLSTAREPVVGATSSSETVADQEVTLKTSQAYQRRLYPLLERLRQQNLVEVNYAYALAYRDINDPERAMQTITPLANDPNNPLRVQAVFLRADLLADTKDYNGAVEQLQVLEGSPDVVTKVRAKVKQAALLFDAGQREESKRMLADILVIYTDLPAINDAYLLIGLDRFNAGDFDGAYRALNQVGKPGAPPRESVAIGTPLEIKVADAKLNARVADIGLPVTVQATSGDKEEVTLKAAFSRGVYMGTIDTALGAPAKDGILQVQGGDKITVTYVDRMGEDGADKVRTITLDTKTDGQIVILSQAALSVYREVQDYQKKNILDDRWELVGKLPKTASAFFRNPDDGTLRKKGTRFDRTFITNIKPGQSIFLELTEPDKDTSANKDSVQVELKTQTGKGIPVTLTETGEHTGIFTATAKTGAAGQAKDGALEVVYNDTVTGRYVDANPAAGSTDPERLSRVTIRSARGTVVAGLEVRDSEEDDHRVFIRAYRVSTNNTPLVVKVEDRDLDNTDEADKVTVKAKAASGAEQAVTLTETGTHTGIFTGVMKVSSEGAADALKVKSGDDISILYQDDESPDGATATQRAYNFKANMAEAATLVIKRQIVEKLKVEKGAKFVSLQTLPKITWEESSVLTPGSVYHVIVNDPDVLVTKAGMVYISVTMKSSNGASVDVPLLAKMDDKTQQTTYEGDFFMRLGDAGSPSRAFFSQTGAVAEIRDEDAYGLWSLPALNAQGKDKVQAVYIEPLGADGAKNVTRTWPIRVAADAQMSVLNMQGNPLELLKPGMPFELQIEDPNGDLTGKRDTLKATITSSTGDKEDLDLLETDIHTGIFSTIVKTAPEGGAATGAKLLTVAFDGKVTISYKDEDTVAGTPADRTLNLTTRPLADAEGVLLTKIYDDPKFEVETLVRLGESLYALGAAELATKKPEPGKPRTNDKIQEAARLMQQVIDRFPTSEYVVESLYLTGKIRREEQKYDEAVKLFKRVIDEYPDSEFVPQALYQLVLLYYDRTDIDQATESAMHLVYGFPKSPLVADAFLRIAEFYYNKKEYLTAAFIYKRVMTRFPDNPRIELINYRMATAYYRAGLAGEAQQLANAIRYYMEFANAYKDHELADDAYYWAANASMKQGNAQQAFNLLTKMLITYPTSDMLAYAKRLRDQIKEEHPGMEAEQ